MKKRRRKFAWLLVIFVLSILLIIIYTTFIVQPFLEYVEKQNPCYDSCESIGWVFDGKNFAKHSTYNQMIDGNVTEHHGLFTTCRCVKGDQERFMLYIRSSGDTGQGTLISNNTRGQAWMIQGNS